MQPYSYELPLSKIAQRPVHPAEAAKLLVVDRQTGVITDSTFSEIAQFLNPEDILYFNNTKVIPARLFGEYGREGLNCEILLTQRLGDRSWKVLGKPLKKILKNATVNFPLGLRGDVLEKELGMDNSERSAVIEFNFSGSARELDEIIHQIGVMPIPPYIRGGRADAEDLIDYQPLLAKNEGSIASPTASLHFSNFLLEKLKTFGVTIEEVTLHVGAASFLPILRPGTSEIVPPQSENFVYSESVVQKICNQKEKQRSEKKFQGRNIAVGTTVVRALETMMKMSAQSTDSGRPDGNQTDLFISPGFQFKALDALVTNFHQPGTTHLLLVEALLGRDLLEEVYDHALGQKYRFLSYGDGMMIL